MYIYKNPRSRMLLSAAFFPAALIATLPASAQTAAPAAAASDSASTAQVEDIVVTAQRREQSLQDVPVAVAAVTANTLAAQGITSTIGLSQSVAGLDMAQENNAATPFLRGVGTPTGQTGNEPSVATYVDGVYMPSALGAIFALNNIERIEVLKGPQGTLFGRNATGGVIQVVTRDPSEKTGVEASAGYGNYQTYEGSVYATTGLWDGAAIDIAAYGKDQRDGWGHNIVTGQDISKGKTLALHSKLKFNIGDLTTVRLSGDYNYLKSDIGLNPTFVPGALALDGQPGAPGFYDNRSGSRDFSINKQGGVALRVDHDAGFSNLVSITSFRALKNHYTLDQDATALPIVDADLISKEKTFSQEVQIQSPHGSTIQWIAGVYFYHDISEYSPLDLQGAAAGGQVLDIYGRAKSVSYAGFGQVTVPLFQGTNLTGGLRYTIDDRKIDGHTDQNGVTLPQIAAAGTAPAHQSQSFNKLTWRVSLDHKFDNGIMIYASQNRGFKSGQFNTLSYAAPVVKPEVLDAYEVGVKSELFDRRLRLNVAGFYYNYKDIQVNFVQNGFAFSRNAAKARIKGIDADFVAAISQNFHLRGGAAYLHGRYIDFPTSPVFTPTGVGGNNSLTGNVTGNDTVRTPKFSANVGGSYVVPTSFGDFTYDVNYYYNSGYYWAPDNRIKQPHYQLVNMSLGWQSDDKRFGVKAWTKNLFKEKYYIFEIEQGAGDTAAPAEPRTYGLTLTTKF